MNWPEQLEYAVADRQASVRREMFLLAQLRQLPQGKPRWQRWAARLLVAGGERLSAWGTALSESPGHPMPDKRIAVSLGCAPGMTLRD